MWNLFTPANQITERVSQLSLEDVINSYNLCCDKHKPLVHDYVPVRLYCLQGWEGHFGNVIGYRLLDYPILNVISNVTISIILSK